MLANYKHAQLENIELRQVGQQTDKGRYPIHWHMCFDTITGDKAPYVRGLSIHNSFARCTTLHGTHGVTVYTDLQLRSCYV